LGVRSIADDIVAEMAGGDDLAAEAVQCLARLLLIRLARRHAPASTATELLNRQALARLLDYVDANLGERIRVADMAAVSGLSVNSFAHAYTVCTGQSPHQFVLARRLHRATELLKNSALNLAEIAAACGFSSQQHLTSLMRRRMGTTPGRFRAVNARRR
jgi:AraC family transcriptional regulator